MTSTALINCIIVTVNPQNQVLYRGTIVWKGGVITALGPSSETPLPQDCQVIDGHNRLAVLPGLIDVHTHSSLLKGYSENLNFLDWLPAYQREHYVLNEDDAYWAFMMTYLESLKGGTTCVLDMYRFMHQGVKAATELGIRAHLAPYVADMDNSPFENMHDTEALIKAYHGTSDDRIRIMVGLEHLFYCSPQAYQQAKHLSDDYSVFIHTHSSEFKPEVDAVIQAFGQRPGFVLKDRGILGPKTIIAHGTWLDDDELSIFKDHDVRIAHCPTSNVKLGGGTLPLRNVQAKGIKVGLGTDGSISNNSLSMWELMKMGSLLQKNLYENAQELNAVDALRLGTIEGAKVLGLDHQIGSLEIGKHADIITINLWQPHLLPIEPTADHDPVVWNLIYAGRASDVKDVWVKGHHVIHQGQSTRISEQDILEKSQLQTRSLLQRRQTVHESRFIKTS